jgi:cell division protein ZapA (FtsZ GTPase activity inhibitor)
LGNSRPALTHANETTSEEKIARLLAILVVRDIEQSADKIRTLKAAGFAVAQMAPILSMTENAINVALHRARKMEGGEKKRAKSADRKGRKR